MGQSNREVVFVRFRVASVASFLCAAALIAGPGQSQAATTLDETIKAKGPAESGYRDLKNGRGEPHIVREEGLARAYGMEGTARPSSEPPGGYGRHLIERALPYALGAETTFELEPGGLRCTIDLPLDRPKQARSA